ncbi:MAG: hypothetical protein ACPGVG_09940, partial [Mycobacterium sp.]
MVQPDAYPHRRKSLPTSLGLAAMTGATTAALMAALALPAVAHAQPAPPPPPPTVVEDAPPPPPAD